MGRVRTGAPTWAQYIRKACKLSHMPGFTAAATLLLGSDATDVLAAWHSFCLLFEAFLGKDDWPLEIDHTLPFGGADIEDL